MQQSSAEFGVAEVLMSRSHMFNLSHQPPPPPAFLHHLHQYPQPPAPASSAVAPPSPSPQLLQPSASPETPPPIHDFSRTMGASMALPPHPPSSNNVEDHDGLPEDAERGLTGNRWPRQETLALIKIRSDMDSSFKDASAKGPLWEEVSRKLAQMGYNRSAKKCKEKFENVHKYYKRTKDGKTGRQDGKIYRFFDQLEALYGKVNAEQNVGSKNNGRCEEKEEGLVSSIANCTATEIAANNNTDATKMKLDLEYSSGLSFSTDQSSDEEGYGEESRKRKRMKCPALLESLMKKIVEKQEQMQKRFLEALERRENERMVREEAWKRQEMARVSREQELRAQERTLAATRDAALVAFLQKVTGQTFHLPQLALPSINPSPPPAPELAGYGDQHPSVPDLSDPLQLDCSSRKRWPKAEVLALIKLRSGLNSRFHDPGVKAPLWDEISAKMASLGYHRSPKRCKEKWENINKYFKKAKDSSKKRPENAKTCPYFHQLDALYSKGLLGFQKQASHKLDSFPQELLPQPATIQIMNKGDNNNIAQLPGGSDKTLATIPSEENAKTIINATQLPMSTTTLNVNS